MDHEKLLRELEKVFGRYPRPDTLLDMGSQYRSFYSAEVVALENMDWENGRPDDLRRFYEPNTFLSVEGYRYLLPRVFAFCLKWREELSDSDFIEVMLSKPIVADVSHLVAEYSSIEKKLLWNFLEEGHRLTGTNIFEDYGEEANALRAELLRPGRS